MPFNTHDSLIVNLIEQEKIRQNKEISLIASENYAPANVRFAMGSELTNKYAEGVPGHRYYAGCRIVDKIEQVAIDRAKELFGADHANVQPHSGSQANMAVYMSCLKPGSTIMGMALDAGGHLTHGYGASFSGLLYNAVLYGLDKETELIDYELISDIAHKTKPALIIAGASAYSRIIDYKKFAQIADSVGALLMVDIAHIAGLVAARIIPSPVSYADFVTSTTQKTLVGPRGGFIMCTAQWKEALDKAVMPGIQGGPFMHCIAAKATCFSNAMQPSFIDYAQQIINNAQTMAQALEELGYRIVSGGTDNHLFIVDLRAHNITGRDAEKALEEAGITVSRSCIPFDTQKPYLGSGIRIGTSAITTRGMLEAQAITIVHLIDEVIKNHTDKSCLESIKARVQELAHYFPIPC